jgi:DNA-binding transcriptional LysR family regulator
VFLAVARSGRMTTAAAQLGINHTTVARRLAALERDMRMGKLLVRSSSGWQPSELGRRLVGHAEAIEAAVHGATGIRGEYPALTGVVRMISPDAFGGLVVGGAMAWLRRRHPGIQVEMINVARRAQQHRVGLDLEVVVGRPTAQRAEAIHLSDYRLGVYASRAYLAETGGAPRQLADLDGAPLVYYVTSLLEVDLLDRPRQAMPALRSAIGATNVFVHVEATRAGAGVGVLPCYVADRHDDLVRLLPDELDFTADYWLVAAPEVLRRPVVRELVDALVAQARTMQLDQRAGPTA